MQKSMTVVSAHAADYVWRAGGTIAKYVQSGWEVNVLVLSLGVRGESTELWRQDNQNYQEVERIRREESIGAARVLGCAVHQLELEDYPIEVTANVRNSLVDYLRQFRPSIILTHSPEDPFNLDHPRAYQLATEARLLAGAAGVSPGTSPIAPTRIYAFEPHQSELSGFRPDVLVDVSDQFDTKIEAMQRVPTQSYLVEFHRQLAETRAYHARRNWSNKDIKFAEAFQSCVPIVTDTLP